MKQWSYSHPTPSLQQDHWLWQWALQRRKLTRGSKGLVLRHWPLEGLEVVWCHMFAHTAASWLDKRVKLKVPSTQQQTYRRAQLLSNYSRHSRIMQWDVYYYHRNMSCLCLARNWGTTVCHICSCGTLATVWIPSIISTYCARRKGFIRGYRMKPHNQKSQYTEKVQ